MAATVRCSRIHQAGSSAVLVAAWLLDVLAGLHGVRLDLADAERVVFEVEPSQSEEKIREVIDLALAEPRFAGWRLLE